MSRKNVLIIEDNSADAAVFKRVLEDEGFDVGVATTAEEGLQRAKSGEFEVVLTDLNLGGPRPDEGRELIKALHSDVPHLPVILMTGSHTADMAIDVIKVGAFDYFSKPLDAFDHAFRSDLADMIHKAADSKRLMQRVEVQGTPGANEEAAGERIVGRSRIMRDVYKEIGRVADKPVTVLIRGETGTGKELVASYIYTYSSRANQPFIVVNCAAIPENLLESELFGHESGAFTGAKSRRLGRFELAHQGTIFLDEIGDMDVKLQQKLLRVLQEGTIERVGGKETIPVDVRVLAATHRNLEIAVQENAFRQDLYFRLNVAMISLPALRERTEDIPELVKYFIERYGPELGATQTPKMKDALKKAVESFYDSRSISGLAEEYARAIKFLQQQQWPGNVRELANVIRKALLLARRYPITEDIVRRAFEQMRPSRVGPQMPFAVHVANMLAGAQAGERQNLLAELLEAVDRELYTQAIRRSDGDQTKVTRWLGVSRPTVRDKLTRYGIHPARDKN